MNSLEENVKTGVVALVGPPNVGKSTLLNTLLGQKISIVSPKAQTTRNRIMGIVNGEGYQILMLDTPGIHQAESPLNKEMVKIAMDSLHDVEIIVFMIDVTYPLPERLTKCQAGPGKNRQTRHPLDQQNRHDCQRGAFPYFRGL